MQKQGIRMQGQQRQAPTMQAEWARDRGNQDLEGQGSALRAAEAGSDPDARVVQPHAGGGVQHPLPTWMLKTSDGMKAYDMPNSSPTTQGPSPCSPRRTRTGDD